MVSIEECKKNPQKARQINVDAVAALIYNIDPKQTHLIYCSTDMVFSGLLAPYNEDSKPAPCHVYGETKAQGEEIVRGHLMNSTLIRFALMFGKGPPASPSFLGWLHQGLESKKGVTMYTDEYRTALYVNDAAKAVWKIIQKRITGIIHLAGPDWLSREEFALQYAKVFEFDKNLVKGVLLPQSGAGSNRPPDLSMDINKAKRVLGFHPLSTVKALEDMKQEFREERLSE